MLRTLRSIVAALVTAGLTAASHAQEVLVTLSSGDTIRATLIQEADGVLTLKHPILGELKVPRTQVARVDPAPAQAAEAAKTAPAVESAPAPAEAAKPAEQAVATAPAATPAPDAAAAAAAADEKSKPKWSGSIEGNLTGVAAENDQWDLRVAAKVLRETPDDKLNMYAEYFLKTLGGSNSNNTGSAITDSNLLSNVTYDRFLNPGPWLWFAKGQYEYDINQNWENRLSGWAGLGYKFLDDPAEAKKYNLTGKLGFGTAREFGGVDEWFPQMYAEIQGFWQFSERQKITFSSFVTPDVADFNNYMILTRLEWSMKLDYASGLSLMGGLRDQYQSPVKAAGSNTNDLRVYLGFKLDI